MILDEQVDHESTISLKLGRIGPPSAELPYFYHKWSCYGPPLRDRLPLWPTLILPADRLIIFSFEPQLYFDVDKNLTNFGAKNLENLSKKLDLGHSDKCARTFEYLSQILVKTTNFVSSNRLDRRNKLQRHALLN